MATGQDAQPPEGTAAATSSAAPAKAAAPVNDAAPAKLTGAQKKAKQKADKAARRAQAKDSKDAAKGEAANSSQQGAPGSTAHEPMGAGGGGGDHKNKQKVRRDSIPASASASASRSALAKTSAPAAPPPIEPKNTTPECFSHLSMARRLSMTSADKDVHSAILTLGQEMATFAIDESIARLEATLVAIKEVIRSYTTPPGNTLSRHFTPHVLNPQVDYLSACRPMCFAMGNAIRWLKLQVSKIDPDMSEEDAKDELCASIDSFIKERIMIANVVITENAALRIQDDDVVLTYGHNTLTESAILHASANDGKRFSVIVVDDPYEKAGQALARNLVASGIPTTYSGDLGGLSAHLVKTTKVFLGADSMFNNGALYAPAGTCDVALAARQRGLGPVVLCETINITERVATDSLTYNEIDPERSTASAFRLLYDTTPERFLTHVVTELGTVEPTSVPDLLRKLEESN